MKIAGLDLSITHTGAVIVTLDETLAVKEVTWLTFTTTKKYSSDNCLWYAEEQFADKYDKYKFMQDRILDFVRDADMVAVEDYAFGATGQIGLVFDLAEFEGWIRQSIWRTGKPLYLYSPMTIKKVFTGHGDSDKKSMWNSYVKISEPKPDLIAMPLVTNGKKGAKGTSDVVDAYAAAMTLRTELLIERDGVAAFPKHIQEFWKNRTRTVIQRPKDQL